MNRAVALFHLPGSTLARDLDRAIAPLGAFELVPLALDAAHARRSRPGVGNSKGGDVEGVRVVTTAEGTSITWQGVALLHDGSPCLSAALFERPVFAWPQPWTESVPAVTEEEAGALSARAAAATSLTASALRILETLVPCAPLPSSAHLASAPAIALARLERHGVSTHPWSLKTDAPRDAAADRASEDVLGGERWCSPSPRFEGPRIEHAPLDGACESHLLLGGESIAREAWAEDQDPFREAGTPLEPLAAAHAERSPALRSARAAARALSASLCSVLVVHSRDEARVVAFDPAPDLARWSARSGGGVLAPLARWLHAAVVARDAREPSPALAARLPSLSP